MGILLRINKLVNEWIVFVLLKQTQICGTRYDCRENIPGFIKNCKASFAVLIREIEMSIISIIRYSGRASQPG
ncbi:MAG: hypothetical protein RLZZ28_943 [Bacteroidota bacterium]